MEQEKIKFYAVMFFAFALGALCDLLFYKSFPGVSFFVFIALGSIFSVFLADKFGRKISQEQILILAAAVLLAASVFLRASFFLLFFNIIGSVYLAGLFFALFTNKNLFDFGFLNYIFSPINFAVKSFFSASGFIEKQRPEAEKPAIAGSPDFWAILKGIIIALPFLAVFISLLSSADTVFEAYLNNLINIKIDIDLPVWILRAFKVFILSFFFTGVFALALTGKKSGASDKIGNSRKILGFTETAVVLGLIESLFLFFIAIQFYYLFGGRDYVWGIDKYITYSEYARSGFYELIITAIISFFLIFGLDKFGKRESGRENKIFKILSGFLAAEIIIILFSSFSRLALYADGYGFTFQRFLAFVLLFWIGALFILFLYKIIAAKKEEFFFAGAFLTSVIFWIIINILNPDAFIAQKNIERARAGKELDSFYFSSLSEDAVPEIVKIFAVNSSADEEAKEKIAADLYYRYDSREMPACDMYSFQACESLNFGELLKAKERDQDWRSFNVSKSAAIKAIKNNYGEIIKYQSAYWEKEGAECREAAEICEKNCKKRDETNFLNCRAACGYYACDKFEKIIETNK